MDFPLNVWQVCSPIVIFVGGYRKQKSHFFNDYSIPNLMEFIEFNQ